MNIFVTDLNPEIAARNLCDRKAVSKLSVEIIRWFHHLTGSPTA